MLDVWVHKGRSRKAFEGSVEFGDAVLSQEAEEVESLERRFPWGGAEHTSIVCVESLKLGKVSVKGRDVLCPY